jgi:hypothetical protein
LGHFFCGQAPWEKRSAFGGIGAATGVAANDDLVGRRRSSDGGLGTWGEGFAPPWCGKPSRAPSAAAANASGFPNRLIARIPVHGMFVAMRCRRQVEGRTGIRRPRLEHFHQSRKRGSAVKRKLASVLVSLVFGWLATAAMAEDDATATTADSSSSTSEPATATTDQSSNDTASVDTSTSDGTIAASPTDTATDSK